jgi:hypothetical protein
MERTDCNADMVWPQVGLPKHRRAKMHPNLSPLLPIADIDFGGSFGVNMLPLEVGTNAEHRAGSPLTLAAVAGDDGIGIGGYFDTQGTTRALRGSRHSSPPSLAWARLQEGSYQSDPLLSIVLLALRSLGGEIGGVLGRCGGRFAKQVALRTSG